MKKQYLLKIMFAMDANENRWSSGAFYDHNAKSGQRFYESEEQAKAALNRLMERFNSERVYDTKGNRIETTDIGGGFGADMVIDKRIDDMNRIVKWSIQVREVTPWEIVERWDG